jgi:hypothetical protein
MWGMACAGMWLIGTSLGIWYFRFSPREPRKERWYRPFTYAQGLALALLPGLTGNWLLTLCPFFRPFSRRT